MKNKEIEELLNRLKNNDDWYVIENKEEHNTEPYKLLLPTERDLLLSYIKTLKNRNKELYEGFIATQEELTDYATKNEQLKNNRNEAVREIMHMIEEGNITFFKGKKLENILMGDNK